MRSPLRLSLTLSVVVLSITCSVTRAEEPTTVRLDVGTKIDRLTRVTAELEVGGELRLQNQAGKITTAPMSVSGAVEYDERILEADPKLVPNRRSIRNYRTAEANVVINNQELEPDLRDERALIGVAVKSGRPLLYSPQGLLTAEELDVIDLPGNTLFLDMLLPNEEVAVGKTWKTADQVLAALLSLENVNEQTVKSELKSVKDGAAEVALDGKLQGVVNGVNTVLELKGKYLVDVERQQVAWITLVIKERREIGIVGPGLDVTAKLKMTIAPLAGSDELNDEVLAKVKSAPTAAQTQLELESEKGGFRVYHDRNWHVTSDQPTTVVLRRIDKTDTVAQCNVNALAKLDENRHDTLTGFQNDVKTALGKNFGEFSHTGETKNARGLTVFQAFVTGNVQEVAVEWRYYLLVDSKTGRRVALAFTIEGNQLTKLGTADQDLVEQLEIFEPAPAAAKAGETQRK